MNLNDSLRVKFLIKFTLIYILVSHFILLKIYYFNSTTSPKSSSLVGAKVNSQKSQSQSSIKGAKIPSSNSANAKLAKSRPQSKKLTADVSDVFNSDNDWLLLIN